jgi:hypothetical protein
MRKVGARDKNISPLALATCQARPGLRTHGELSSADMLRRGEELQTDAPNASDCRRYRCKKWKASMLDGEVARRC